MEEDGSVSFFVENAERSEAAPYSKKLREQAACCHEALYSGRYEDELCVATKDCVTNL